MSELTTFDDMTIEAIEVACQSAFEECESVFRAIDSKKNQLEIFGRLLTAAKKKIPHGEWENWLTDTFQGRLPFRTAQRWMQTAKAPEVALLKSKQKNEVPREERKTDRVQVSKPEPVELSENPGQLDENAVPAEPQTNTKHRKATAKAKESDRPVPAAVTPEIVDEPQALPERTTLSDFTLDEIFQFLTNVSEGDVDNVVKRLRRLLDRLDPPKAGKTPSRAELVAMIPDDWAPELQKAAADWAEYKQARAKGERIQTVRAWELALEKFTSQPSKTVISKVNKAIENSWKGWDHDSGKTASAKPEARKRDMSTYYQ